MKNLRLFSIAAVTCALVFTTGLSAAVGDLDTTFDADGIVRTDFAGGSSDRAYSVAVQADGKIVAAGDVDSADGGGSFALARYKATGALDPTFDGDGKVRTRFAPTSSEIGTAGALQPDGKIVMAGAVGIPGSGTAADFALARYNSDGTLDAAFDGDGKVITDFSWQTDYAVAVAVQSDRKIVAAGWSRPPSEIPFDVAVARYNPDGSLDTSFSGDGRVTTAIAPGSEDFAQTVAVQPDGKIIVGGGSGNAGIVVRYLSDGSLDASFDGDGIVMTHGLITDVAVQADGRIVTVADSSGFSVGRLNADGTIDTSFGEGGMATAPLESASAHSLAVQPDGNIVAAGSAAPGDFAVARFRPNGALDGTFGSDGTIVTDLGGPADFSYSVALAPGGKIVLGGISGPEDQTNWDFAVARYVGAMPPCKVPNVRGKRLGVAKARIRNARCTLSKVTRKPSKQKKKGRVLSQSPRAGAMLPNGGKVKLVVGTGRRG
jgi:uncharacterized delta-60 repeat protein